MIMANAKEPRFPVPLAYVSLLAVVQRKVLSYARGGSCTKVKMLTTHKYEQLCRRL